MSGDPGESKRRDPGDDLAASLRDERRYEDEQRELFDIPDVTAPVFPSEHTLNNSAAFFQRAVGGGMLLKFAALVQTPVGFQPAPEAVVVVFNEAGWERFKALVARDGVASPIETVRTFPGGLLNGGAA